MRQALKRTVPSLDAERALWDEGHEIVVGIDEVGRGAWAGPLTLGAAVVPKDRRVNKIDRKSTRLNSSHIQKSRMPSSA